MMSGISAQWAACRCSCCSRWRVVPVADGGPSSFGPCQTRFNIAEIRVLAQILAGGVGFLGGAGGSRGCLARGGVLPPGEFCPAQQA